MSNHNSPENPKNFGPHFDETEGIEHYIQNSQLFMGFGKAYGENSLNNQRTNKIPKEKYDRLLAEQLHGKKKSKRN